MIDASKRHFAQVLPRLRRKAEHWVDEHRKADGEEEEEDEEEDTTSQVCIAVSYGSLYG